MFWYRFTDWDGLDPTKNFVGLDNYVEVFTDPSCSASSSSASTTSSALVRADGARAVLRDGAELQDPVQEPVQGHPVLPVPDQRRRDRLRSSSTSSSPAATLDTVLVVARPRATRQQWLGDPDVVNYSLAGDVGLALHSA